MWLHIRLIKKKTISTSRVVKQDSLCILLEIVSDTLHLINILLCIFFKWSKGHVNCCTVKSGLAWVKLRLKSCLELMANKRRLSAKGCAQLLLLWATGMVEWRKSNACLVREQQVWAYYGSGLQKLLLEATAYQSWPWTLYRRLGHSSNSSFNWIGLELLAFMDVWED